MTASNADLLRERFFERLRAQRPASVLDVGCGAGHLLRACRRGRIPAQGVEDTAETVLSLRKQGFEVALGTAESLPFGDGELDWVAMRHVPHHLLNPRAAIAEAARVARAGLLLAEPWREPDRPEQEWGRRYDAWVKRQDRRLGRIHNTDIPPRELAAMLPGDGDWELELEFVQLDRRCEPEVVRKNLEARVDGIPESERSEFEALVEHAGAIGENGSAILLARRRG